MKSPDTMQEATNNSDGNKIAANVSHYGLEVCPFAVTFDLQSLISSFQSPITSLKVKS